MSFKLSNEAKAEKSIDVRENDKDVREIDVHLAEVLRLIDPFDFVPAVHFAQRIDITNMLEPLRRREMIGLLQFAPKKRLYGTKRKISKIEKVVKLTSSRFPCRHQLQLFLF